MQNMIFIHAWRQDIHTCSISTLYVTMYVQKVAVYSYTEVCYTLVHYYISSVWIFILSLCTQCSFTHTHIGLILYILYNLTYKNKNTNIEVAAVIQLLNSHQTTPLVTYKIFTSSQFTYFLYIENTTQPLWTSLFYTFSV